MIWKQVPWRNISIEVPYWSSHKDMCEWQIMGLLQCPKAHRDFFVKMRCDVRLYIWLLFTLLACLLDTMKIFALSSFSFCCSVWLGVRPKDRLKMKIVRFSKSCSFFVCLKALFVFFLMQMDKRCPFLIHTTCPQIHYPPSKVDCREKMSAHKAEMGSCYQTFDFAV